MKVVNPFTDKITKKRYEVGDIYEGSKERIAILTEKGFLAAETDKKKK